LGLRRANMRGAAKVTAPVMFAVLALSADQLLRWATWHPENVLHRCFVAHRVERPCLTMPKNRL